MRNNPCGGMVSYQNRFDSICHLNQYRDEFSLISRANQTSSVAGVKSVPYRIRHRNNRNMTICLSRNFRLGKVGKLCGKVGKSLAVSNPFAHCRRYTFKSKSASIPRDGF